MKKIKGFFTILGVIFFIMVIINLFTNFSSRDFPAKESIGVVKIE